MYVCVYIYMNVYYYEIENTSISTYIYMSLHM